MCPIDLAAKYYSYDEDDEKAGVGSLFDDLQQANQQHEIQTNALVK